MQYAMILMASMINKLLEQAKQNSTLNQQMMQKLSSLSTNHNIKLENPLLLMMSGNGL